MEELRERIVVAVVVAFLLTSLVSGLFSKSLAKPHFLQEGFSATYGLEPHMVITEMVVNPDDPNDVGVNGAIGSGPGTYSWQMQSLVGSYAAVKANLNLNVTQDLQTSMWWNRTAQITVNVDDREATAPNGTSLGTINYWIDPSVQKGDNVTIYGKPPYQINETIMNYIHNPVKVPAGQFDCWVIGISTRLDVGPPSVTLYLWYDMATGILVAAQGDYFDVMVMLMGIEEIWTLDDWKAPVNFVLQSYGVSSVQPLLGDVNGDGKINIMDITMIARAFNSSTGDPRYRPECDLNGDGTINIIDITTAATQFQKAS